LLTTLPLLALAVMAANDHYIRIRWPSWLTGKLSDFAVVLVLPFLLTATYDYVLFLLRAVIPPVASRRFLKPGLTHARLAVSMGLTALVLSSINLSERCRDLYLAFLHAVDPFGVLGNYKYVVDPSDCIALVLLPAVWWWGQRTLRTRPHLPRTES